MDTSIIIDEIKVTMEDNAEASGRSCFVVFSSHEDHIEIVIDCVESVFDQTGLFDVRRLDKHLTSGDSQYGELRELLDTCCFGVVILDGFRPNVLFEYGILQGLKKPCIVLVEKNATADVFGYFENKSDRPDFNPAINMDRHFSDVKDRFFVQYDKNDPKDLRSIIEQEYQKLKSAVEEEFLHMLFPNRDFVEKELTSHLSAIIKAYDAKQEEIAEEQINLICVAGDNIVRIANDASIKLPFRFYRTYAKIFERSKNYDVAYSIYDSALDGSDEDFLLLMSKGFIHKWKGEYDDAIKMLDLALKHDQENESVWHNKALVEMARNERVTANKYYKKAISFNEDCSLVHFHYGILLFGDDENKKALTQFNKALKLDSENTEFQLWKAKALFQLDRMFQAVKILNKVVASDPTRVDAWFTLGRIEENEERSIELFNTCLEYDPEHAGALCSLASRTANIGKPEEALLILEKAVALCQQSDSCSTRILNASKMFIAMDKPDDAVTALEEFVAKYPEEYKVRLQLGSQYAYAEKYEQAFETFDALQEQFPEEGDPAYYFACTYALKGEPEKSVEYLDVAIPFDSSYIERTKAHSDFDGIRSSEVFKTWLSRVG